MRHLLQTILNLLIFQHYLWEDLAGILWYGKLPKVSTYHRIKKSTLYKFRANYNEINSQVLSITDVPKDIQDKIIFEYLDRLYVDNAFKANLGGLDIPIFDGKEVIGNESVYGIFRRNV